MAILTYDEAIKKTAQAVGSVRERITNVNSALTSGESSILSDLVHEKVTGKYYYIRTSDNTAQIATDANYTATKIPIDAETGTIKILIGSINAKGANIFFVDSDSNILQKYIRSNTYISNKLDSENFVLLDTAQIINDYPNTTHILWNLSGTYVEPKSSENIDVYIKDGSVTKQKLSDDVVKLITPIETYFENEMVQTVTDCISASDSPSIRLLIATDTHYDPLDANTAKSTIRTLDNIKEFCKRTYVDGIAHLGDIVVGHSQTPTGADSEANPIINFVRGKLLEAHDRVYIAIGNHDGDSGNAPMGRNYSTMSAHNEDYVTRPSDFPYFYVDYPKQKIRCFYLSNTTYYAEHSGDYWGIDNEQLAWLRTNLLNVENDWEVIIFSHIPVDYSVDYHENLSEVRSLLNAFHGHTGDFSSKTGKIVAWVAGHMHYDRVASTPQSGLNFPCISLTCSLYYKASYTGNYAGSYAPPRTRGTYTEDCWTVFVYTPETGIIKLIRFGGGVDKTIDTNEWDVSTEVISWA